MKPAALLATVMLILVSIAHLARLVIGVEIIAGEVVVPMWVSVFGFLVPGGIAFALWREGRER